MISRVFRGRRTYGVRRYLFAESDRCPHVNPRVIGCWDGRAHAYQPPTAGDGRHNVGPLSRLLDAQLPGARVPAQHVYHLVLRNHDTDRVLSDEDWAGIARRAGDGRGGAGR